MESLVICGGPMGNFFNIGQAVRDLEYCMTNLCIEALAVAWLYFEA